MDNKTRERMLKILALAQGGVGGEKENAERMLEALCKKHGVTLDQLEAKGKVELLWFYCNSKFEKRLLSQIVDMMVSDPERRDTHWVHKSRSRAVGYKLTPAEHAQVKVGFETYKESWLQQQADFFTAFIWKNRIYGLYDREERELTPEQKERNRRAAELMHTVEAVSPLTRIENK